jgi:thioredoxin-like negative regulator of GroEL
MYVLQLLHSARSEWTVIQVEAESQPDIAESFDIEAVPAFIVLRVRCIMHVSYFSA